MFILDCLLIDASKLDLIREKIEEGGFVEEIHIFLFLSRECISSRGVSQSVSVKKIVARGHDRDNLLGQSAPCLKVLASA